MASKFWINVSSQIDKQKNKQKRPISFSAVSHQTENSYPLSRKIIKWLCYKSKFPKTKIDATNWQYALQFSSVQSLSHVRLLVTPRAAAQQPSLSISKYRSLIKLMSIESVMPSNHLISSSVIPFSSHLQSFPASETFPMSPFFTSGGQSVGVSASTAILPMNIQDWFPLGLTGLISLQSKELPRVFSNIIVQKHQFFGAQLSLWSNSHIHTWLLENV